MLGAQEYGKFVSIFNVPTHGDFPVERVAVSNYVSVAPVSAHAASSELQGQLCQTILRDHNMSTALKKKPVWCIAITFADEENNGFVTLGGAGWETQAEWEQHWQDIFVAPMGDADPANLIVDKLDQDGDMIDEKRITAGTAERLLGRPLAELIAEGRAKTPFTMGQLLERDPELAAKFRSRKPAVEN